VDHSTDLDTMVAKIKNLLKVINIFQVKIVHFLMRSLGYYVSCAISSCMMRRF
jgi:hypothetical protein